MENHQCGSCTPLAGPCSDVSASTLDILWSKGNLAKPATTLQLRQAHSASIELLLRWVKVILASTSGVVQVNVKNRSSYIQGRHPLPAYWTHTYFFHQDLESIFILSAVLRTFLSRRALLSDCRSPTAMAASNTSFRFFCRPGVFLQHRPLPPPRQLNQDLDILPQVALCAYEENWRERTAASDFRDPLLPDVLKGSWADHAEAEQQGVSAAVAEVAEFRPFQG
ncbi:hypothetical protein INR49_031267 [Caranx melampygus]|nr:hypothetical protein INR49_031267 [Caranx melampygus]